MPVQITDSEEIPAPLRAARERVKIFSRLAWGLGLIGFVQMAYSGWFIVFALLFLTSSLGCAITALVYMAKARALPFDYALMVLLILGCAFMAFSGTVQLIFIDQTSAYAECMNSALTLSRQGQCTQQLEEGLLGQLLGGQ